MHETERAEASRAPTSVGPHGLHHIAFGTRDIEATYDYYNNRLGMPLVHCENHLVGDGYFRHFFFDMGRGESLGFFAIENVGEKPDYRTDISTGLGMPGWVNHVAFNVDDEDALEAMAARCRENDVKIEMQIDHGWCRSIYLQDPNGILVEFTTTVDDAAFEQGHDRAYELLHQPPEEFDEALRKDESSDSVTIG